MKERERESVISCLNQRIVVTAFSHFVIVKRVTSFVLLFLRLYSTRFSAVLFADQKFSFQQVCGGLDVHVPGVNAVLFHIFVFAGHEFFIHVFVVLNFFVNYFSKSSVVCVVVVSSVELVGQSSEKAVAVSLHFFHFELLAFAVHFIAVGVRVSRQVERRDEWDEGLARSVPVNKENNDSQHCESDHDPYYPALLHKVFEICFCCSFFFKF